jgi:hypothetical protein
VEGEDQGTTVKMLLETQVQVGMEGKGYALSGHMRESIM